MRARRDRIEALAAALETDAVTDTAPTAVRELVLLASQVHQSVELPAMTATGRDRVRDRLLAELHLEEQERVAPARPAARTTPRAFVATGLASALVAASGVTVAAQEALPGDLLYGLKKATESVRGAVAADPVEISRLELRLARERLDEVVAASARERTDDAALVDALAEMDRRSVAGVEGLVRLTETEGDGALLREAATFTEIQYADLTAAFRSLPRGVQPHAEDSLALLRALWEQRIAPAAEACDDCLDLVTASATPTRSSLSPLVSPLAPGAFISGTEDDDATTSVDTGVPSTTLDDEVPTVLLDPEDGSLLDQLGTRRSTTTDRTLVPPLPGPLDDVGGALDDTVTGLLDGAGSLLNGTTEALDDGLNEVTGSLGDLLD